MTIPLHSLQTKIQRLKHNWMKKVIPFQQILVCVSVYVRWNKSYWKKSYRCCHLKKKKIIILLLCFVVWIIKQMDITHFIHVTFLQTFKKVTEFSIRTLRGRERDDKGEPSQETVLKILKEEYFRTWILLEITTFSWLSFTRKVFSLKSFLSCLRKKGAGEGGTHFLGA